MISVNGISVGVVINECTDGSVSVSARSDGTVNVQIIMEELGGGGHQTVAGVQLNHISGEAVKQQIIELTKNSLKKQRRKKR